MVRAARPLSDCFTGTLDKDVRPWVTDLWSVPSLMYMLSPGERSAAKSRIGEKNVVDDLWDQLGVSHHTNKWDMDYINGLHYTSVFEAIVDNLEGRNGGDDNGMGSGGKKKGGQRKRR